MDKSNAIKAHYNAEIHINIDDVELILLALQDAEKAFSETSAGKAHVKHVYKKFNILYNELKGGKHAQPLV